jgi:translocation and assembly module TamA
MKRILSLLTPFILSAIPYEINFVGLKDEAALKSMLDVSDLVLLQNRPPASLNGLKYRISSDIPDLLKVLRAYGYYDAMIHTDLREESGRDVQVYLYIQPGEQYTIGSYEILKTDCNSPLSLPWCTSLTPDNLGNPAISIDLVNTEQEILSELSRCGHPLASVESRKYTVDMKTKEMHTAICVNEGPLAKFGAANISGLHKVKRQFIEKKIMWDEGSTYNPVCIEETQKKLLNTKLFSSVLITHDKEINAAGELPMNIQLLEAKHRQFSLGAFYATVDGFGGNFSWANRNFRGEGQDLSLDGEFSMRFLAGSLVYKIPDFLKDDQSYKAIAAIERTNIYPYTSFAYRGANYFERKFNDKKNFIAGFEVEHINVSQSANNGTFLFASLPFMARFINADDLLNPTKGYTIVYQASPYLSLFDDRTCFIKQRLTTTFYVPMRNKKLIWAARAQFGSIAGANQKNIPIPILFLGASEDDLRGYRYLTVSPLNEDGQPLGGRSAIFLSAEARLRITELIGLVPFADFGTVTLNEYPTFDTKWYKSVGIGARFFTFFGPLRFDVGFPLDKRKHIDKSYRIYASVGQTF